MSDAAPINPYEPPRGHREVVDLVPESDHGPWRDDGLLVVDVQHLHRMPRRCVLTGVDVASGESRRMKIYFRGRTPSQSSIRCDWPLSRTARPKWRFSDAIAWGSILLSVAFLYRYVMIGGRPRTYGGQTFVELLFIGAGLAIFGFILLNLYDWRPLVIHRRKQRFAWIDGVHPNFLKHLPPWPEPPDE